MPRRKMTQEEKDIAKAKKIRKAAIKGYQRTMEMSLEKINKSMIRSEIRPPTYTFEIGDRVKWGNWDWVGIVEKFNDGMYYKVMKVSANVRYGQHEGAKFYFDYAIWTDIRPYRTHEEIMAIDRLEENEDIHFSFQQRQVSTIFYLVYGGSGIKLDPDYQRDFVWELDQKIALIDSIFRNIDIGKFTIIRRPFKIMDFGYEVLDGKQRIQALIDFYECRFKYNGYTFNDLHGKDRSHFRDYSISWAETEPITKEQTYRYFLKLNVSGVPISEEHIRKIHRLWKSQMKRD